MTLPPLVAWPNRNPEKKGQRTQWPLWLSPRKDARMLKRVNHPVRTFSSVKNTWEHLKNAQTVIDQDEPGLNLSSSSSEQQWSLLREGSPSNNTDSTHKGVSKGQLREGPGVDQPESSPESNQTSLERPEKSNYRSSPALHPDEGQKILKYCITKPTKSWKLQTSAMNE